MKKVTVFFALSCIVPTIVLIAFLAIPQYISAQTKPGAPTVKDVKDNFIDWWTHDCKTDDQCSVTFDSPIRIGAPVRHTFQLTATTYTCYPVKVDFTTHTLRGTYQLTHHTRATYYFYRNSFGEWEVGTENERTTQEKDPIETSAQNNVPKKQPTPGGTPISKQVDVRPKPDFSAMSKWFEIVKYEYPQPPEWNMTIYFKPKVDIRETNFQMEFRDKDGILLGINPAWICCVTQMAYTKTGEMGKATVQVPNEKLIGKVVSAVVVGPKN